MTFGGNGFGGCAGGLTFGSTDSAAARMRVKFGKIRLRRGKMWVIVRSTDLT